MPIEWCRATDLGGHIWRLLGFLVFSFLLLCSELEVEERGVVPQI
jgi:hypothetical protein